MKKILTSLLLVATFTLSAVPKSEAAAATVQHLRDGNIFPAIIGGGATITGIASSSLLAGAFAKSVVIGLALSTVGLLGLFILEDGRLAGYEPLDDEAAKKLEITDREKESYNNHIDSFNVALNDIASLKEEPAEGYAKALSDLHNDLEIPKEAQKVLEKINSKLAQLLK